MRGKVTRLNAFSNGFAKQCQFGAIRTEPGNLRLRGTAWWGWEIYNNCDLPMIWSSGTAHFVTLNVKRNFQYAPHTRDRRVRDAIMAAVASGDLTPTEAAELSRVIDGYMKTLEAVCQTGAAVSVEPGGM
jgi:hypothetical protein